MDNTKQQALTGVVWSSIQRFGVMAITFVSNIILARLLTPDDFGCIGMLMIFISLSTSFIDGGFGSALIQKKEPTNHDYSTIFYWNIFLSVFLYGVLYVLSPFIASFYKIPLLSDVLKVQGVILFFNALSIIQQNQLRKRLEFKKLAIVNITSAVLSLGVAIVFAYKGYGVWALVAQQITLSVINAVMFWIVGKWKPNFVFSWKSFKELFSFGGFMLLSQLLGTLSNEIQGLLVGRKFNAATMGLYTQAYRLEGSAATATSSIIDQVTYPILASYQDDRSKFLSALKRFIQIPAYICSLVMMIMIVIAKPLIILLYSSKWVDCVPYFQILCTAGLAVCLQGSANNAIAAIGKSKVFFVWTIIKRSLTIILCVIGITIGGMYGLLWACVAGAWSVYFINAYLVSKHIGYAFHKQLLDILPFIIISIIIGITVYFLGSLLPWSLFLVALLETILCATLYLLVSKMLNIEAYSYLLDSIKNSFFARIHKNNI